MPKSFSFAFLGLAILTAMIQNEAQHVQWQGSLKAVHHGDVSAKVDLNEFSEKEHLYALGPVAGLDGEVTILNSTAHIAQVRNGLVETSHAFATRASFLVWAEVPDWQPGVPLGDSAATLSQLDSLIETLAQKSGLDLSTPFPFLLKGTFEAVDFHILTPSQASQPGTHHKDSAKNLSAKQENGTILGFFSRSHAGVFTHHDSATHLHIVLENGTSGHVDALIASPEVQVLFPK